MFIVVGSSGIGIIGIIANGMIVVVESCLGWTVGWYLLIISAE